MKHLKLTTIIFACVFWGIQIASAQTALTFTSNKQEVRFTILVDGEQMTNFFETWIRITNIPEGYHQIHVVSENDSVADYSKNIMCKNGKEKSFAIIEKKDFKKKLNESGRNTGEKLNIGEHDTSFNYLQDKYEIKLIEQIPFKGDGTVEIEVSTENSLSSSILPVAKKKQ